MGPWCGPGGQPSGEGAGCPPRSVASREVAHLGKAALGPSSSRRLPGARRSAGPWRWGTGGSHLAAGGGRSFLLSLPGQAGKGGERCRDHTTTITSLGASARVTHRSAQNGEPIMRMVGIALSGPTSCRFGRARSWSDPVLGEDPAEHREVAVMSQDQISECVFREPGDGIVFVWCSVDGRPRPPFDQPDLHVARGGTNFMHRWTRRRRDVDAQFLSELSSKCRAGKFPGLHVATGQIPDVGIPTALGRSVTQQYSVAVPQQRRDDASPGSMFCGDRHRCILPPS